MSEAVQVLHFLLQIVQFIHDLHINPLAAVIAIAAISAWLEHTHSRRRVPDFTTDHRGVAAGLRPGKPRS